ncbi:hypothetical protein EDB85DRAFT_1900446 [Lactarius pseudohatsudake]|nr:hypothetical protein EDB85DRAFT_1900446 [Lactarius pseudohatsudake]
MPILNTAATTPSDAEATLPSQNDPVSNGSGTWGCQRRCQQEMKEQQQGATHGSDQETKVLGHAGHTNTDKLNQLQPGGQGIASAAHFDAYYKALSDAEKEVHEPFFNATPPTNTRKALQKTDVHQARCHEEGKCGDEQRNHYIDQFLIAAWP